MNDTDERIPTNMRRIRRTKLSEKLGRKSNGTSLIVPTILDSTDSMNADSMERTTTLHSMDLRKTMNSVPSHHST